MNRNRKISKRMKRPGNKEELKNMLDNCVYMYEENSVKFCSYSNDKCFKTVNNGKCQTVIRYSETHTLGDLKNG